MKLRVLLLILRTWYDLYRLFEQLFATGEGIKIYKTDLYPGKLYLLSSTAAVSRPYWSGRLVRFLYNQQICCTRKNCSSQPHIFSVPSWSFSNNFLFKSSAVAVITVSKQIISKIAVSTYAVILKFLEHLKVHLAGFLIYTVHVRLSLLLFWRTVRNTDILKLCPSTSWLISLPGSIITADIFVYVNGLLSLLAVEAFQVPMASLPTYIAINEVVNETVFDIFSCCTGRLIANCSKPFHKHLTSKCYLIRHFNLLCAGLMFQVKA